MFLFFLVILPWILYWIFQKIFNGNDEGEYNIIYKGRWKNQKVDCTGKCNPVYHDQTRQWKHTCNKSVYNQLALTTCIDCMTVFDGSENHAKCVQGHCKHCGQRFRYDIPCNIECFDFNLSLWTWCLQCKMWHCANCNQRLHL